MILYHMSQTLQLGDMLYADYWGKSDRYQTLIQAFRDGLNCVCDLIEKKRMEASVDWNDLVKWCVEGAFEYIRETEFSPLPSRLSSNYYFDDLSNFEKLYQAGWAQDPAEIQAQIHLFEIEIAEDQPRKFDMCIFDEAFDIMVERQDIQFVLDSARRYFSGEQTAEPIWEIMSDKPARAVKDITAFLHGESVWQYKELNSLR